ncbi:MAG: hypothetical protein IT385_00670 [Deltaproteobacteria bacterium]|nr:hypothetical protein [Deltaproteobacteria bacterium]
MRQVLLIVVALQLVGPALAGCGEDAGAACRVGADCASGVCRGDGTCAPPGGTGPSDTALDGGDADASGDEDTRRDVGTGGELGADVPTGAEVDDADEVTSGVCAPIDDEVITRAEVPLRAGLYATFRIATEVAVDLAGGVVDGVRTWDLVGPYDGDADARVELGDPTGAWYTTHFPGATYAARLSSTEDYLGVFELQDDALLLRGVVSPEDGLFATRLEYDPAVVVLRFPLEVGATWTSDATVTGLTLGVPSLATEAYASEVDAAGRLVTPFGTFDVLRVRTTLTRTVGLVVTTLRQMAFVSPCFGTVALVVSGSGEGAAEFTEAAEVRRLAP